MGKKTTNKYAYGWAGALALALLFLAMYAKSVLHPQLPTCDSRVAERLVMSTFNNQSVSQVYGLRITRLEDATREGINDLETYCHATAVLNEGTYRVAYTLYWLDPRKRFYDVRVAEFPTGLSYGGVRSSLRQRFGGY